MKTGAATENVAVVRNTNTTKTQKRLFVKTLYLSSPFGFEHLEADARCFPNAKATEAGWANVGGKRYEVVMVRYSDPAGLNRLKPLLESYKKHLERTDLMRSPSGECASKIFVTTAKQKSFAGGPEAAGSTLWAPNGAQDVGCAGWEGFDFESAPIMEQGKVEPPCATDLWAPNLRLHGPVGTGPDLIPLSERC